MEENPGNLSRFSILIVDDVPLNCTLVEKMVARFNFDVRTAGNGLECLREIIARKPDLILLDLMMPIMDGFEVLSTVRSKQEFNDIKIIVLSALNSNEDIVRAYNLGANDFLTKPILLSKLTHSIATQLDIPVE
ncbi:MAG: response regulator [Bacteroidales bacterium]|nr:response regulator [Bacteroidales bacterium]